MTLLLVLAFGLFGSVLVTRVGYLAVPSAVGLPYGLPGLRVVPVGQTTWLLALTDSVAALLLVLLVAVGTGGFWRTWGRFVLAVIAADLLRSVVAAQLAGTGIGAYAGYLGAAVVAGLLWGIALGWLPGLCALARRTARIDLAG
ncbi:MAG: hypothetical protein HOY71_39920 [Nonomuraea sp.]|nr:hypothetical protein [Nonomuraea sp.]